MKSVSASRPRNVSVCLRSRPMNQRLTGMVVLAKSLAGNVTMQSITPASTSALRIAISSERLTLDNAPFARTKPA